MKVLDPSINVSEFFNRVGRTKNRALLLDYDGTLAPFQKLRHRAFPHPDIQDALNTIIAAGHTHLAIISGRHTGELIPLLGLQKLPEIWGSHGHERLRESGLYDISIMSRRAKEGLRKAQEMLRNRARSPDLETKPGALAIHWRGQPKTQQRLMFRIAMEIWKPLADQYSLQIRQFDGGLELRTPGRDKGSAVHTIAQELGANTIMAYLGDDLTDEDAFRAVKKYGLGVLVRTRYRKTLAQLWLKPPEELIKFLDLWIENCAVAIQRG